MSNAGIQKPPLRSSSSSSFVKPVQMASEPISPIDANRTKVLFMGQRRSGKSTAMSVVFRGMSLKEAHLTETTTQITKVNVDTIIPLQLWDTPGTMQVHDIPLPLTQFATLVFVIDIQDRWEGPISKLIDTIDFTFKANPDIRFEIIVHKAEGIEEYRHDAFRDLQRQVLQELEELEDYEQILINFHMTSVYDHSIHEAFSRIVQLLVEQLPTYENLLNALCANSQMSKAFLYDVTARIFVATDASPVDNTTHNLCCDYLKLVEDFSEPYHNLRDDPSGIYSSHIRLAPETTLAYWQITETLALVCILTTHVFQEKRGLIEYNIVVIREGIQQILDTLAAARR